MPEEFTIQSSFAKGRRATTINIDPARTACLIEYLRGKTCETFSVTLHSGQWETGPFDSVTLFGNNGERLVSDFRIPEP